MPPQPEKERKFIMPGKKIERKSALNPSIVDVEIGIRNVRKIKIYPLSLKDQMDVSDLIIEAINEYFELTNNLDNDSDLEVQFISFLINLIQTNITRILSIVTDENGEELLSELTNPQVVTIAEVLYRVNYETIAKNLTSLIEKGKKVLPSMRQ